MYSNKERAAKYRLVATGLHALAKTARHEDTRQAFLELADRYERLAESVEALPDTAPPSELPDDTTH